MSAAILRFNLGVKRISPIAAGPSLREFIFENAQKRRVLLHTRIATITGSNGKTTVKEMLAAILKTWQQKNHLPTHVSVANQNTKLALGLQILTIPENTAFAVFEMGARRMGDFQIPMSYVRPQVVALLNIGTAHAGEFGSLENLVKEKLSALEHPSMLVAVVPADDARIFLHAKKQAKAVFSFGYQNHADVRIVSDDTRGVVLLVGADNYFIETKYQAPQRALNIAAAFAIAISMGLSPLEILEGIKNFHGVDRRFQQFTWQGRVCIDDAFNASPESMREGLKQLSQFYPSEKVLLVLGSMLELGPYSKQEHQRLAEFILQNFNSPSVVTVGAEAQVVFQSLLGHLPSAELLHYESSLEAKSGVEALAKQSQVIYFKGSKSIQLQKIFSP